MTLFHYSISNINSYIFIQLTYLISLFKRTCIYWIGFLTISSQLSPVKSTLSLMFNRWFIVDFVAIAITAVIANIGWRSPPFSCRQHLVRRWQQTDQHTLIYWTTMNITAIYERVLDTVLIVWVKDHVKQQLRKTNKFIKVHSNYKMHLKLIIF